MNNIMIRIGLVLAGGWLIAGVGMAQAAGSAERETVAAKGEGTERAEPASANGPGTSMAVDTLGNPSAGLKLSPLEVEYFKSTLYRLATDNASALALGEQIAYSDISLGMGYEEGSFHRPQQPARIFDYGLTAEGALSLGKIQASGGFRFLQSKEKDVKFSSILDPFRGTPYIIADSTGGDWTKQAYDVWAQGVSPLIGDVVSFGLRAGIGVCRGAKKIDPRPQSNSNQITVTPSVTMRWRAHALSGDYTYRRFRENTNLMLYNSAEAQKLYLLKGMGQYVFDIFSANERERQYEGDGHTAGVEYHFTGKRFRLMVRGAYENYVEGASDIENSKPRQRGRIYEQNYSARLVAEWFGDRITHTLEASYGDEERSGREIIQVFVPDAGVNSWVTDSEAPRRSVQSDRSVGLRYALMVMETPNQYKWRVGINGELGKFADEYAVRDSYNRFKRGVTDLELVRNIVVRRSYYRIALSGKLNRVWDTRMNYLSRETDDPTIEEELVRPDVAMLWQNYYGVGGQLTWGYRFNRGESVYVSAAYAYRHTTERYIRNAVELRVGYSF